MNAREELFLIAWIVMLMFLWFHGIIFIMGIFDLWRLELAGVAVASMIILVVVYFVSLFIRIVRGE